MDDRRPAQAGAQNPAYRPTHPFSSLTAGFQIAANAASPSSANARPWHFRGNSVALRQADLISVIVRVELVTTRGRSLDLPVYPAGAGPIDFAGMSTGDSGW